MEDDELDYSGTIPEEDQVAGQDVPEPGMALPAEAPVMSRPVGQAAPIIMRGHPDSVITYPGAQTQWENPEQLANRAMWQRLQYNLKDSPLAETEAAVSAALKYQALRQYQDAVASGVNPSVALSRVAPSMFSGRNSTLGNAASFINATAPKPPKLIDVGGVLYRQNSDGSVIPLTQPRERPEKMYNVGGILYRQDDTGEMEPMTPAKERLSETEKAMLGADVAELKGLEKQIAGTEEHGFGVFHPLGGNKSEMDALRQRAAQMRQKIRAEYGEKPQAAAPTAAAPSPSPFKEGQVIRNKKDNKRYRVTNGTPVPVD